ncbi:putative DNA-binding transcriptional regulator AlpA [Labrenzia sp. EL_126]|nr:putative DNA-binding transcriptional regulator AlpA [Labrenzia sp. EL_126]
MDYITIRQLSKKLGGRALNSIYTDVEEGRLPKPVKFGGKLLWRKDLVDAAVLKLANGQGADWPAAAVQAQ